MNLKHYYLGECYFSENYFLDSIREFEKQLKIYKTRECLAYLGIAHAKLGNFEESLSLSEQALDPDIPSLTGKVVGQYPGYYYNLGALNFMVGDNQKSIEWYNKGFEVQNVALNHDYNWGVSLPLLKELYSGLREIKTEAWTRYSSRFFHSGERTLIDRGVPRWTGGTPKHDEILVLTEQGLGDRIQFGKYIELLKPRFKKIWVAGQKELEVFYKDYHFIEVPEESSAKLSVPLLDLANIFYEERVPAAWLKNKFNSWNGFKSNGKKNIIIEWTGNNYHSQNGFRNCNVEYFKPLASYANLYNIKPDGEGPDWITYLNSKSWEESANYVNGCDLVISIDTSLVHLAGSLGKPCWMLEPWAGRCWRWGNQDLKEANWWYPTVKVIRNHFDWKGVFETVLNKIESNIDG